VRFRCPFAVLVSALFLVLVGSAVASPPRVPAPPPSSCRMEPSDIWASLLTANAVPDLVAYQDYRAGLALAPTATGKGVRIADVEYEWLASHVDLAAKNLPAAPNTNLPAGYQVRDHGTAVLGVLGASADGKGITGIAPDATLLPISPFIGPAYKPAQAITTAAAGLGAGDVMLVELQAQVPDNGSMVPIEAYPEVRAAIAKAVAKGIVVGEPAANSGLDLGSVNLGTLGTNPWAAGMPGESDSGALLVGGGGSGSDLLNGVQVGDLQRTAESNFGARVDLQGYGAGVVTSGYADLQGADANSSYTACFDGTSSASATVAGAVAVVQGQAIARFGKPLTPAQMRVLLRATGEAQVVTDAGDGRIGPRPQVAAAIAAIDSVRTDEPAVIAPSIPRVEGTTPAPTPVPPATQTPPGTTPVATSAGAHQSTPAVKAAALRAPLARIDRRTARLTLTLRNLAPSARITVNGKRKAPVKGALLVTTAGARTFVVRITAPRRAGVTYRPARFVITIPRSGAPRVTGA